MKHPIGKQASQEFLLSLSKRMAPEHLDAFLEQMDCYITLVMKHAEHRQLLAASQRNVEALWLHVFDSLQVLAVSDPASWKELWDAGSGNGLPGVPLAVALPAKSIHLIDRSTRKAEFLELTVATLGLRNTKVTCMELSRMFRDAAVTPTITARALVQPNQWHDVLKSITSLPDWIIFATRANADLWERMGADFSYVIKSLHTYTLPGTNTSRCLLKFTAA